MPTKVQGQTAIDELIVEDSHVEGLLEERAKRAASRRAVSAAFKEADTAVRDALAKMTIPEDGALRIGRFRITKQSTPARHVEFDAEAGERLRIDGDDTEGDDE